MKKHHISFPSIVQFRDVIKQVRSNANYHNLPVPSLTFTGTVKLHGTNAALCRPVLGSAKDIYFQSRERILDVTQDNAGFAVWGEGVRNAANKAFDFIYRDIELSGRDVPDNAVIQIFGEWCGGNIQRGVGINALPKMFVIFALRVSVYAESEEWLSIDLRDVAGVFTEGGNTGVYAITSFPTFRVSIDFTRPELVQNTLVELTNKVEEACPVATELWKYLDKPHTNTIGEGIVWEAWNGGKLLRFKVKGEKHSVTKVKTVAAIDVEKVASVNEFVAKILTENRMAQGIDKLKERGLEVDVKNTGEFIKWCVADSLKEELDTLVESGLTPKDVTSTMATTARQYFMKQNEAQNHVHCRS